MTSNDFTKTNYLETVYNQCNRDTEQQVSMYEAGASIGLEKNEAGALAEELMVEGLLDLKTLAGGVSLTPEGLNLLGIVPQKSPRNADQQGLSDHIVINETDQAIVQNLIEETKKILSGSQIDYAEMEEIVFDIKTIEVQLLSPQPKSAIIREILSSIQSTLSEAKLEEVAGQISICLGNR